MQKSYHVSLLSEDSIVETLWSHPLQWQLCFGVISQSEVALGIDTLREAEISNFYNKVAINPIELYTIIMTKVEYII